MLNWSKQFDTFCFLDNHQYQILPHTQECILAAGVKSQIFRNDDLTLENLHEYVQIHDDRWLFGHLNYDLKNELENLRSNHPDQIGFPDFYFFEPSVLIRFNHENLIIESGEAESIWQQIEATNIELPSADLPIQITHRLSRDEYIATIVKLKDHILRGDCYEINFCQEFFAENAIIDPVSVYLKLSSVSPNPFSALYRLQDKWLICASPERFIKKQGDKIISQPIKGTSPRIPADEVLDMEKKRELFLSSKDRSENVMIVDLVRNDLAKVCNEGSVKVEELYGIYSFPQVHQMISTISGTLKEEITFAEIIRATFPMGSMTGAPKKRVMELIEEYEQTRRGIFSGAIGYIDSKQDFDFNVVIRSILYNSSTKYLSYLTGSGITFYSDPEMEWQECLWKAEAIKKVLQ